MDPAKRACVEAWLQYGEDLGIGPYFRDRAATAGNDGASPALGPAPLPQSFAANAAVPPSTTPGRAFAPGASNLVPPVALGAAEPSLFEIASRIEGDTLERIREDIGADCARCKLSKARKNIVFGVGNPKADLVFIGEGPGHDEDVQGEPFVGRAGKLLTQMIEAMGLRREDVYICNVVKCRPPENRLPEKDEIATCSPFLLRQIAVIQPKVLCALGACAAQTLLQTTQGISRFRGEWFDLLGAKFIATYHPAYLLRNPVAKGEVWKDLQKIMTVLGLQPRRR